MRIFVITLASMGLGCYGPIAINRAQSHASIIHADDFNSDILSSVSFIIHSN